MREEANSEIRVKLHITSTNDSSVKNVWMCLNYDQKPNISHVIEHIKTNYCNNQLLENNLKLKSSIHATTNTNISNKQDEIIVSDIKLYLDDYLLPPYENSRLIRENDCIKVDVKSISLDFNNLGESEYNYSKSNQLSNINNPTSNKLVNKTNNLSKKQPTLNNEKNATNQLNNYYNNKLNTNEMDANYYMYNTYNNHHENEIDNPNEEAWNIAENNLNDLNNYNSYYPTYPTVQKPQLINQSKFLNNDDKLNTNQIIESQKLKANSNEKKGQQTKKENNKNKNKSQKNLNSESEKDSKTTKQPANCYKKFSIGSYVHLLNEPVTSNKNIKRNEDLNEESDDLSEEQIIDDYYQSIQNKKQNVTNQTQKNGKKEKPQMMTNNNVDLDKIASNLNSTGRSKWKNSSKPTTTNGPKHIIFPSSDSSDSSSDNEEKETKPVNKKPENKVTNKKENLNEKPKKEANEKKGYYQPTKEEQLNAVSSNRSFVIQNPKTLAEFKKVFNETKLNAPMAEKYFENTEDKKVNNDKLNESISSETGSTSSGSSDTSNDSDSITKKSKKSHKRRSSFPKIDYEKLESLSGQPRVEDKLAFQILEISRNFTPEISSYKSGTVVDFDNGTNEVTIKLNQKYNSVLKKPSKFSVVLDEDENGLKEIDLNEKKNSESNENEQNTQETEDDNLLKVDWRNLINIKILPKQTEEEKEKITNVETIAQN